MIPYRKHLKPYSRNLRENMTDAERVLWSRLRRKQVNGLQFNRQKPLGEFIVDFYCHKIRLVIEVDGAQHFSAEQVVSDRERDEKLRAMDLVVLRFDNRQVLAETGAVMDEIYRVCVERVAAL